MTPRPHVRPWRGDGRPPKLNAAQVRELHQWAAFGTSKVAVARRLGIGKTTLDRYLAGEHVRTFGEVA